MDVLAREICIYLLSVCAAIADSESLAFDLRVAGYTFCCYSTYISAKSWFYLNLSSWQEVVDFCKSHLVADKNAFFDSRLQLLINDAR